MISALTGELRRVDEDRVHVSVGPLLVELLVAASDIDEMRTRVGEELTFHTQFYIEGDASGGNLKPRLLGFLRVDDKRFFEKFVTVKGIGPKTALKALTAPVGEVAQAIESKDARFLVGLNGIGKRTAELIIAELAGKVQEFAAPFTVDVKTGLPTARRGQIDEDAISALMALGERRPDAEYLLERAKSANPKLTTTDALVREMLRMRTVRTV